MTWLEKLASSEKAIGRVRNLEVAALPKAVERMASGSDARSTLFAAEELKGEEPVPNGHNFENRFETTAPTLVCYKGWKETKAGRRARAQPSILHGATDDVRPHARETFFRLPSHPRSD